MGAHLSFFEGDPFSDEELRQTAGYLAERRLIAGSRALFATTPLGRRSHLAAAPVSSSKTGRCPLGSAVLRVRVARPISRTSGTCTAALGEHVTQTLHQGISVEELQQLIAAVRDAAGDLDGDQQDDFNLFFRDLAEEAQREHPDSTQDRAPSVAAEPSGAGSRQSGSDDDR